MKQILLLFLAFALAPAAHATTCVGSQNQVIFINPQQAITLNGNQIRIDKSAYDADESSGANVLYCDATAQGIELQIYSKTKAYIVTDVKTAQGEWLHCH